MRNSGVPVADFIYVKKGGKINIVQTMIEKGWEKGFIKAAEGRGARETMRFDKSPKSLKEAQEHCDRLLKAEGIVVEPYLKYVGIVGEISCCYYGNKIANVV